MTDTMNKIHLVVEGDSTRDTMLYMIYGAYASLQGALDEVKRMRTERRSTGWHWKQLGNEYTWRKYKAGTPGWNEQLSIRSMFVYD